MAKIYTKTKLEPIEMDRIRAVPLKADWLSKTTTEEKDEKIELFALDGSIWVGTYGQIKAIDIEPIRISPPLREDTYERDREEQEKFRRMPAGEKAKFTAKAGLILFSKSRMRFKLEENPKVIEEVIEAQRKFYEKNPNATMIDYEALDTIIKKYCGEVDPLNLVDKMRMPSGD